LESPAQGAGATFGIATDEPFENKRLVLRGPNFIERNSGIPASRSNKVKAS